MNPRFGHPATFEPVITFFDRNQPVSTNQQSDWRHVDGIVHENPAVIRQKICYSLPLFESVHRERLLELLGALPVGPKKRVSTPTDQSGQFSNPCGFLRGGICFLFRRQGLNFDVALAGGFLGLLQRQVLLVQSFLALGILSSLSGDACLRNAAQKFETLRKQCCSQSDGRNHPTLPGWICAYSSRAGVSRRLR